MGTLDLVSLLMFMVVEPRDRPCRRSALTLGRLNQTCQCRRLDVLPTQLWYLPWQSRRSHLGAYRSSAVKRLAQDINSTFGHLTQATVMGMGMSMGMGIKGSVSHIDTRIKDPELSDTKPTLMVIGTTANLTRAIMPGRNHLPALDLAPPCQIPPLQLPSPSDHLYRIIRAITGGHQVNMIILQSRHRH